MSEFDIAESSARAARRLRASNRRRRSDAGRSRLDPRVEHKLQELLRGAPRLAVKDVMREMAAYCRRRRLRAPSRATIYNAMLRAEPPSFDLDALPHELSRVLHNMGSPVPGHQVVFAAFNYGDTRAMSYAATLPWVSLRRAERLPGWRPKSLALLRAIIECRGV